ncbi:hypothetical protein [uncultured Desulfosarcina sp.]|uniref:hypothetical protein n=1 Tax=uncultured Desulfosarcina sp. TaxID=218289 RepID=UPI0029C6ED8B|nr:hypothetical protein [uncultured Desulfosarcina sp.]
MLFNDRKRRILFSFFVGMLLFFLFSSLLLNAVYDVPFKQIPIIAPRIVASELLQYIYSEDSRHAEKIVAKYFTTSVEKERIYSVISWIDLEKRVASKINYDDVVVKSIPFVYESLSNPSIIKLKNYISSQIVLDSFLDEYSQMLMLFEWIGRQWDHGTDIPSGGYSHFDPLELLRSAREGGRFWCEVSARFTVYAATAMGWPSRLVSLSRSGYKWEHAVAEVWSNQFGKWFVVDTDFNLCYEKKGVPLSAFELCHCNDKRDGFPEIEIREIAPKKPSIKMIDLLPYYSYCHIDLRNDWLSRDLAKGSPVGGDRSTWWTAREHLGKILTIMKRIDEQRVFDWPVNVVDILPYCHMSQIPESTDQQYYVGFEAYSPYFYNFEWRLDWGEWITGKKAEIQLPLTPGRHSLMVRIRTIGGYTGPINELRYRISDNSPAIIKPIPMF